VARALARETYSATATFAHPSVLWGVLVTTLAVRPRSIVVKSGDFSRAFSPRLLAGGSNGATFGRRLAATVRFISTGAAPTRTLRAINRVLGRELMAMNAMRLTGLMVSPMPTLIPLVVRRRVPSEVFQTVVVSIPVVVTRLKPLWAWTDKSLQH